MPRFAPVLRGSLGSSPGPAGPSAGYALSCRKLVLEYSEKWLSSKGATSFVGQYVPALAARYPSVEVVCMEKPNQHPLVRAFYNTDREKVVSLRNMEPMEVAEKLSLLLDSSGKKLTNLKRKTVVAGSPESARGMWSQLHGARN